MKNFLLIIIFTFSICYGQQSKETVKKIDVADKLFNEFAFVDARQIYLEVAESNYGSEDIYKKLADSYYFNSDFNNAQKWYEKLYEFKNGEVSDEYLLRYGMSLKANKSFEDAENILKIINANFKEQSISKILYNEEKLNRILELQEDRFQLSYVKFNSQNSDIPSSFIDNSFYLTSNREQNIGAKIVHEWNNKPFYDIYKVDLNEEGAFNSKLNSLENNINSIFHEMSPVFTKDGLTMYFSRNNFNNDEYGKSKKGINKLKIYKSTRKDKESIWKNIVELPFNSSEFNCSHPCLNDNETELYFVSDMPGTEGMSDIFKVEILEDNKYGKPSSLGKYINTSRRENFPFIKDNKLFFASDGHFGIGGLDLFVTELSLNEDKSTEIINLGEPINSSKDDFSFFYIDDTKNGFFASNRDGGKGDDDIYQFEELENLISNCKQSVKGIVKDEITNIPLKETKISMLDEDLNYMKSIETNENGEFIFDISCNENLVFRAEKEGYGTKENLISVKNEFENVTETEFLLDQEDEEPLEIKKINKGEDLNNILGLQKIHFDYNDSKIRKEDEAQLQKVIALLKKFPQMKIDVRSHTDSRGDKDSNLELSVNRANSTINYIVSNGIEKNRVMGNGFGESILLNHCEDNINCSEQEHDVNRRSEFIVLNDNYTPHKIINEIKNRDKVIDNYFSLDSLESEIVYDFSKSNKEEIYTVQIAATIIEANIIKFNNLNFVYKNDYLEDNYRRYYSGYFKSKDRAIQYKNYIKHVIGIKDAWVVRLKGDEKFDR